VAVSGDTVAVGAYQEASNQTTITNDATASSDNSAFNAGAAYVFRRTGVTWEQESYLKAPNAEPSDQFGSSVSVSSDSVAVGAIGEDSSQTMITNGATASEDNIAYSAGAVYIFVRT
jgi:histidinol phosphatase-like PHP family hydrolase